MYMGRATQDGQAVVETYEKKKNSQMEKGMANYFIILALRIPWTVWKGKRILQWKMNSPGW